MSKEFIYKIYDNTGTFIKNIPIGVPVFPSSDDVLVLSSPKITSEINGGQGELRIDLNARFDDFDEGVSIKLNNIIKLYQIDDLNPKGVLLYAGIIQNYEPFLKLDSEGVTIIATSIVSSLSKAFYKSGGVINFSKTTLKASELFEEIIDHFRTIYTNSDIDYSVASVDATAVDIAYDFEAKTWREAIDISLELSETGYWYFINCDGTAYFKEKPATATHKFTVGKHIDALTLNKSMEPINNQLHLTWSGGTSIFTDATSVTNYDLSEEEITDTNITTAAARDERGNSYIADNKNPLYRVKTLTINDSFPSLEAIRPGDTCSIFSLKKGGSPIIDNIQIVKVSYDGQVANLVLEKDFLNFAKQINN